MTRTEHFKELRQEIAKENELEKKTNPLNYYRVICNQRKIKREGGYKH